MTVDVRSLAGDLPANFDFNSQSGILFILRAIRAADILPADKNILKDLVFLYSAGQKDDAILQKITTLLATHNVTPASVLLEKPKVVPQSTTAPVFSGAGFPTYRPTPTFVSVPAVAVKLPAISPVEKITPVAQKPIVTEVSTQSEIKPVVTPLIEKITPVIPVQNTTLRPNIVSTPTNVIDNTVANSIPVPPNDIVVTKNVEDKVEEKQSEAMVASSAVATQITADRLERIRVIKSDVNARVGNPVNLVDVDNTLGREYMTALLEAMKLLSSASPQESNAAMTRLESVYARVSALLDATVAPKSAPQTEIASVPVADPAMSLDSVTPITPVTPVVVSIPVPVPVSAASVQVPDQTAIESNFAVRSKMTDRPAPATVANNWDESVSTKVEPAVDRVASVAGVVASPDATTVARLSTPPAAPLRDVASAVPVAYQPETASPMSAVAPLRAISDLPTAAEVSVSESMGQNPLYTKDVDAGLEQLLGEWSIFKKSGLFGTGPKGREHPLYIKIANLQVPLILSGRFEGSTQEIKQSITDYMNGWRYEQGIVYEANETLELYLRRVIRHIIDLQKTKRRS